MASAVSVKLVAIAAAMILASTAAMRTGEAAVTCNDVSKNLAPCISFLQKGGAVPVGCCAGVKALKGAAATTVDRQTACKCMKSIAANIRTINPTFATQLPGKCGVNIPYNINPNFDCSTVR